MNIQHSSRSDGWQTPPAILQKVHELLGVIDLDPASDILANKNVGAAQFLTKEDDGLQHPWQGETIFINPPGGKLNGKSNTALFWSKLMKHRDRGHLKHAIFLAFSIEALQTTQNKGCKSIAEFPFCVPSSRIKFVSPDNKELQSPSHSNMIIYVPGTADLTDKFYSIFHSLGNVLNTRRHP